MELLSLFCLETPINITGRLSSPVFLCFDHTRLDKIVCLSVYFLSLIAAVPKFRKFPLWSHNLSSLICQLPHRCRTWIFKFPSFVPQPEYVWHDPWLLVRCWICQSICLYLHRLLLASRAGHIYHKSWLQKLVLFRDLSAPPSQPFLYLVARSTWAAPGPLPGFFLWSECVLHVENLMRVGNSGRLFFSCSKICMFLSSLTVHHVQSLHPNPPKRQEWFLVFYT